MLDCLILGPREVRTDGRLVPVQGFRQRALLAMLLVHANEVVPSGRLLDELWGAEPGTDTAVLRVRISQLRKALRPAGGDELLQTRPPGYVLKLDRDRLDLGRHERLAAEAGLVLEHDPARAAARLRLRAVRADHDRAAGGTAAYHDGKVDRRGAGGRAGAGDGRRTGHARSRAPAA